MGDDGFGFLCFLGVAFVACVGSCNIGRDVGKQVATTEWRTQMVMHGCGSWEVKPDGSTEFKWKEQP